MKGNEQWLQRTPLDVMTPISAVLILNQKEWQTGQTLTLRFCIAPYAMSQRQVAQLGSAILAMEGRTPSEYLVMESRTLHTFGPLKILTQHWKPYVSPLIANDKLFDQPVLPGFEE